MSIKKKWISQNFRRWRFKYLVYDESTTYADLDVIKGRIPHGGLILKDIFHSDYRMAFEMRTHAIWVFPGSKAVKEGFKPKKLHLGIPDFIQVPVKTDGISDDFDVIKFDKDQKGTLRGLPYNFSTFKDEIEGELIVKWRSVSKIFGNNSRELYITQKIVFTKYSSDPAHEPTGGINAARIHPLIKVHYGDRSDGYFESIRVDYRFHLNLDTYPSEEKNDPGEIYKPSYPSIHVDTKGKFLENHAGLFKDNDSFVLRIPANKSVFEASEKPIISELTGQGLLGGENEIYGESRWDNIHWWGAGGNIYASAPGAFHAVHLHWRWGRILHKPDALLMGSGVRHIGEKQFKGRSKGGVLTDPNIANQSISFGIIRNLNLPSDIDEHSTEIFDDFFKDVRKTPLPSITSTKGGHDYVLYYSSRIFKEQAFKSTVLYQEGTDIKGTVKEKIEGYVFLHGIFFAHEDEQYRSKLIGTFYEFYKNPTKEDIKKLEWRRKPQIS